MSSPRAAGQESTIQSQGGSSGQTTTPGYAPTQEDFINQLRSIFSNAGQGTAWQAGFQGINPEMANNIAGESARIASARLPQFGLQDSAAGQTQVARVAGDVLRNTAQFNSQLAQSGFMGLGHLLGSQLQGLQPVSAQGFYQNQSNQNFLYNPWLGRYGILNQFAGGVGQGIGGGLVPK